jgi:hypothetical protein
MKKRLQFLFGSGFLFALLAFGVLVIASVWNALTSIDPNLAAGLASAGASVVTAAIVVVTGKLLEQRREIATSQRHKKVEIYEDFVHTFLERTLLAENLGGERMSDEDLQQWFVTFTQQSLLWSSSKFVREWGRYKTQSLQSSTNGMRSIMEFEKVLAAVRKDVGLSNRGLKQGDLLRLFITDVDNFIENSHPPSLR